MNSIITKQIKIILSLLLLSLLVACGEEKPFVADSTVKAAVTEAASLKKELENHQADLLAYREYKRGNRYFAEANEAVAAKDEKASAVEYAQQATAQYQQSKQKASALAGSATAILKARKAALTAGLRENNRLIEKLEDIDSDLRSDTDVFTKPLKPKEFSVFQKKYLLLEVKAVQFMQLNSAKQVLKKAQDNNAESLAPKTLHRAMVNLEVAENDIGQSPRSPKQYLESVKAATASMGLLADTMNVILAAKGTPESVALKVVEQNRALGKLTDDVGNLKSNLSAKESALLASQSNLKSTQNTLQSQNKQLELASTQVRFQKAMEEARKRFTNDEALAYQQGSKLIFRIKKMNFASGKSEIPTASLSLLSKINDIVKQLRAESVIVEGHTDSVGSDSFNLELSTKRATAVSHYLSSLANTEYSVDYEGFGETRPIASNDTVLGRAENRRVDLIVTAK